MEGPTQILKAEGVEPRLYRGSFAPNGTSTPALASSRYPIGFPFTVARSATGTFTVTPPAGHGTPAQPFSVVVSPQCDAAANWFDAIVVGETTTATGAFTVLLHKGGTATDPAAAAGTRLNFAIHFDNSTGR